MISEMNRSLIIGLGNLGKSYDFTRHNVGFFLLDLLAATNGLSWSLDKKNEAYTAKWIYNGRTIILAKPTTLMNLSGSAVLKLSKYYKIPNQDTIIIYDDIAFEVGDFRINEREGTGGHNGISDILAKVGGGFVRYRIGIGSKPHAQMDLKDYVLNKFSETEIQTLKNKSSEIFQYLQLLLDKGVEHAMNLANREKNL